MADAAYPVPEAAGAGTPAHSVIRTPADSHTLPVLTNSRLCRNPAQPSPAHPGVHVHTPRQGTWTASLQSPAPDAQSRRPTSGPRAGRRGQTKSFKIDPPGKARATARSAKPSLNFSSSPLLPLARRRKDFPPPKGKIPKSPYLAAAPGPAVSSGGHCSRRQRQRPGPALSTVPPPEAPPSAHRIPGRPAGSRSHPPPPRRLPAPPPNAPPTASASAPGPFLGGPAHAGSRGRLLAAPQLGARLSCRPQSPVHCGTPQPMPSLRCLLAGAAATTPAPGCTRRRAIRHRAPIAGVPVKHENEPDA